MRFEAIQRVLRISTITALVFGFAPPAIPNEYRDNPLVVVDRASEKQFLPIGELESVETHIDNRNSVKTYGTAFLISPCYIMTNHHVAFGDDMEPKAGKDYTMLFRAGTSSTFAFAGNTKAVPVKWGSLGFGGANDWAIMHLTVCIGGRPSFGWFESADIPLGWLISQHVAVAGFSGQTDRGHLSYSEGDIKKWVAYGKILKYSASMMEGESGSPVLIIIDGDLRVVGLNVGETRIDGMRDKSEYETYNDDNANYFIALADILNRPDIKVMLDADKHAVSAQNPGFKTACFLTSQTSCNVYKQPPDGTNIEAYDPSTGHWSKTGDAAWIHPHPTVNLPKRDR